MAKEEIEIIVDMDGKVQLDAINFEGKACEEALEKISQGLGSLLSSKKKDEYHRTRKVRQRAKQRERN